MKRVALSSIAGALCMTMVGRAQGQTATAESVAVAMASYAISVGTAKADYDLVGKDDADGRRRACSSAAVASRRAASLTTAIDSLPKSVSASEVEKLRVRRSAFDRPLEEIRKGLDVLGGCTVKLLPVPLPAGPASGGSGNGGTEGAAGTGATKGGKEPGAQPRVGSAGSGSTHREAELLLTMSSEGDERDFELFDGKGQRAEIRPPLLRVLLKDLTSPTAPTLYGLVSAETAADDVAKFLKIVSKNPERLGPALTRLTLPEAKLFLDSAEGYGNDAKFDEVVGLYEKMKATRVGESSARNVELEYVDRLETTTEWLGALKKGRAGADSYRALFDGQHLDLRVKRGGQVSIVEIRPDMELETTYDNKLKIGKSEIAPADVEGLVLPSAGETGP